MLKVVIIGAVNSTYLTLEALIRHHVPVTLALGLTPKNPELVSGYCDLQPLCTAHDIPFCAIPTPDPDVERTRQRIVLAGDPPSPVNPPAGCAFHPRCAHARDGCRDAVPPLVADGPDREVACGRLADL